MTALRWRKPEPLTRRTLQPVRRHSRMADAPWEAEYRNLQSSQELNRVLPCARIFDRRGRRRGLDRRNGGLGHVAIEILELMVNLAKRARGWVFPSIDGMATLLDRSTASICRALAALRDHGFVAWARRLVRVEGEPRRRGVQVAQTSNIYRLQLPAFAGKLMGKSPPPPDDHQPTRAEMAARLRMIADGEADADAYRREAAATKLDAAIQRGFARGRAFNRASNAIPPSDGNP